VKEKGIGIPEVMSKPKDHTFADIYMASRSLKKQFDL